MKRQDRRSDCPISFALEAFGDTWSLLVMRDLLFTGKRTFSDFLRSEEGIATNVLAARLRALEEAGLIRAEGEGRNVRYSPTARGLDLLPILLEMIAWSARHDPRSAAPPAFVARIRKDRAELLTELREQVAGAHGLRAKRSRSKK
jgi:DNA-binding HxlR family transcriptional regulator